MMSLCLYYAPEMPLLLIHFCFPWWPYVSTCILNMLVCPSIIFLNMLNISHDVLMIMNHFLCCSVLLFLNMPRIYYCFLTKWIIIPPQRPLFIEYVVSRSLQDASNTSAPIISQNFLNSSNVNHVYDYCLSLLFISRHVICTDIFHYSCWESSST